MGLFVVRADFQKRLPNMQSVISKWLFFSNFSFTIIWVGRLKPGYIVTIATRNSYNATIAIQDEHFTTLLNLKPRCIARLWLVQKRCAANFARPKQDILLASRLLKM